MSHAPGPSAPGSARPAGRGRCASPARAGWGLHLWGDAIRDDVATSWDAPRQRDGVDGYGAVFNIPLKDSTKPVNFIVHRPSGDSVPATREPGGNRSFVPIDHPEIWLEQGDPTIYYSPPPP